MFPHRVDVSVLTGSPFTVKVFGEGRIKESITRKRQAPSIATVGSTCDLNLKIPGELWRHVSASCLHLPPLLPTLHLLLFILAYFLPSWF